MADLRRHDRTAAVESLGEHLSDMHAVIDATDGPDRSLESCLEDLGEGELVDWVAVTVHRLADGTSLTRLHGHPDRTALQVKGLLHDALWAAAHQE